MTARDRAASVAVAAVETHQSPTTTDRSLHRTELPQRDSKANRPHVAILHSHSHTATPLRAVADLSHLSLDAERGCTPLRQTSPIPLSALCSLRASAPSFLVVPKLLQHRSTMSRAPEIEQNRLLDADGLPYAPSSSSKSFLSSIPLFSSLSPTSRKLVLGLLALLTLAALYYRPSLLHSCPYHPPSATPVSLLAADSYPRHILITGGAGYIGSHMSLLLWQQAEPYDVVVVDDLSRGDMRNVETLKALTARQGWTYTFYEHDCGDTAWLADKLQQHSIELVIHFAGFAYASESVQYPLKYFDNIVTKTQGLLAAMQTAHVTRLLYSSSSATYGQPLDDKCDVPIAENTPQVPVSPYGRSKLMAEQVIAAYQVSQLRANKDFSYAALRYFNVIGADKEARIGPLPKKELKQFSRVVDACFDAVTSGEPMKVYGTDYSTPDGTAVRDYIHVWDLVRAHLRVIAAVHSNAAIPYNVGIGRGFSNKQLVEACGKAVGKEVDVLYQPRREGDPGLVLGDASKIQRELGWQAEYTDLAEAIGTAWKWRVKSDKTASGQQ